MKKQPKGYAGCATIATIPLTLIALRAGGVIDWPWWAVLAPVWVFAGAYVLFAAGMIAAATISDWMNRKD
jgi:fatty acid desaturase